MKNNEAKINSAGKKSQRRRQLKNISGYCEKAEHGMSEGTTANLLLKKSKISF